MLTLFREQPRAFYMIFMLEIWERFGFYTMQGVLTLYFIRYMGFSDEEAFFIFGAFTALVFAMVSLGGYLGDSVLGTKRTIILGLFVLALGYLSLSLVNKTHVYPALALICVGSGLFKANPSSLLGKCYAKNDPRLHGGFTLYYMSINLGSVVALLAGPSIASHYGYFYTYFLSFIGLVLGLANYYLQRQHVANINTTADLHVISKKLWMIVVLGIIVATLVSTYLLQHVMLAKNLVWMVTLVVIGIYFLYYMRKENRSSALRMLIAFILMLEALAFFTLYQQMPTSINLFAVHHVNPSFFGIPIDPQSFQAFNPFWIIIMSPVLAALYHQMHQRDISFPIPYKFAAGMLCSGLGFCLLYFTRYLHSAEGMVASWWLLVSYFFQSTGELLVSALGIAMVAELVPRQITGFVMGMWFLTPAIAGFFGASVASLTALPETLKPGIESLMIYTQVFAYIGLASLGLGVLMWLFAAKLSRYIDVNDIKNL